jgi:hypothetical protein
MEVQKITVASLILHLALFRGGLRAPSACAGNTGGFLFIFAAAF